MPVIVSNAPKPAALAPRNAEIWLEARVSISCKVGILYNRLVLLSGDFMSHIKGRKRLIPVVTLSVLFGIVPQSWADGPAAGQMFRSIEVDYLNFIIDHHYSALRMTELAAGTDTTRDAALSPAEGTAPTPNTQATAAKSGMDEIKSMARRENRMQREEILTARRFLQAWYGMDHTPQISEDGQRSISLLEAAAAGSDFDKVFLQQMSFHHYQALAPSVTCTVGSDIEHHQLIRYCNQIIHAQTAGIQDMREMLQKEFGIVNINR
jgi:uncharacterized protein (DUF305 family)